MTTKTKDEGKSTAATIPNLKTGDRVEGIDPSWPTSDILCALTIHHLRILNRFMEGENRVGISGHYEGRKLARLQALGLIRLFGQIGKDPYLINRYQIVNEKFGLGERNLLKELIAASADREDYSRS